MVLVQMAFSSHKFWPLAHSSCSEEEEERETLQSENLCVSEVTDFFSLLANCTDERKINKLSLFPVSSQLSEHPAATLFGTTVQRDTR